MKRTFDYAPFVREFVASLQQEGLLDGVLSGRAGGGAESRGPPAEAGTAKAKGRAKKK